ncbi:DUF1801 domain-containing protein [Kordiimonas sp.]|uniref:DUF1801 domain-containing protein n=1 Tax=Kordiimonas sp. TaxID=1970157 RepID=UPI003A8EA7DF
MKTKPTKADVNAFIEAVDQEGRREDSKVILEMMQRLSGHQPRMWGPSIIGFGSYHYKYDSGREGNMCRIGFSPRKSSLVLYIIPGFSKVEGLLNRLGKHKLGKSCLYIGRLSSVDMAVLEEIIVQALAYMDEKYPR